MNKSFSKIRHIQKSNIILENRLLIEQQNQSTSQSGSTAPTPTTKEFPFGIKINMKDKAYGFVQADVQGLGGEHPTGCIFDVKIRGAANKSRLIFFCDSPTREVRLNDIDGTISPEAYGLLSAHCNCSGYVKGSGNPNRSNSPIPA